MDPPLLSDEARQRLGAEPLPLSLDEALVALEAGERLAWEYLLVNRAASDSHTTTVQSG